MRLIAPEKNYDYIQIDKNIFNETEKISDEIRIFEDKINHIIYSIENIDIKNDHFLEENKMIQKDEQNDKIIDKKAAMPLYDIIMEASAVIPDAAMDSIE